MNNKILVPSGIGVCVDGYGFFGMLDLRIKRSLYGVPEFFGLIKDRKSACYIADYHTNENSNGNSFALKKVEDIHPAGLYYFSLTGSLEGIGDLESYLLFLDEETYCRLSIKSSGSRLPEIATGKKKPGHFYEVVKASLK